MVFMLLLLFTEAPCDVFEIFTYLDHISYCPIPTALLESFSQIHYTNRYLVFLLLLLFTEAPCDIFKILTYLDHISYCPIPTALLESFSQIHYTNRYPVFLLLLLFTDLRASMWHFQTFLLSTRSYYIVVYCITGKFQPNPLHFFSSSIFPLGPDICLQYTCIPPSVENTIIPYMVIRSPHIYL